MDSFSMHEQCEEYFDDNEYIVVDVRDEATDNSYRIVKEHNHFFLEVWNQEKETWNIIESLSPIELIHKVKA